MKPEVKLKEKVENHPFVVICSATVLLLGLVGTPLELWRSSQKSENSANVARLRRGYEEQIANLKQSLQEIPITVGEKSRTLDVANVTLGEGDIQGHVSRRDLFISNAQVYALRPQSLPGWSRSRTSEFQFTLDTTGASPGELKKALPSNAIGLMQKLDLYIWRRSPRLVIGGIRGIRVLYPQIILERIPASAVPSLFGDHPTGTKPKSGLARFYRAEPTGFFLLSQLQLLAASGLPLELTTIEKKANVVYAQIDAHLRDITINGAHQNLYYLTMQLILVSTPDSLYFIKTYLPSAQPYSPDAEAVTQWISNFHIIVSD